MFTYRDFEMGTLGLAWTGDLKNAGGVCEKNGVSLKCTEQEQPWKTSFTIIEFIFEFVLTMPLPAATYSILSRDRIQLGNESAIICGIHSILLHTNVQMCAYSGAKAIFTYEQKFSFLFWLVPTLFFISFSSLNEFQLPFFLFLMCHCFFVFFMT
jgi:hypothetical protein